MRVRVVLLRDDLDFSGNVFIAGFHGIGLTGFIAIKHLISELKAEKIGFIETLNLPPIVSTDDGDIVTPFELYKHSRYVFLLTQVLPHLKEQSRFSLKVADWVLANGFSEVILVGGLNKQFQRDEGDLYRFIMTTAFKNSRRNFDLPFLERGLYAYGLLALMLSRFEIRGFPALAVLPYADASRPDPLAAAKAIDFLNKLYELNVDVTKLVMDAQRIEREVKLLLKEWSEQVKGERKRLSYM